MARTLFLTGTLATALVRGIQGDDPRYLQAIATPKHFAVHSGPEPLRHGFDVTPEPARPERDLSSGLFAARWSTGKAHSLMRLYNAVDGVPSAQ